MQLQVSFLRSCSELLSIPPVPSPFICAGGGFNIFLCSLLDLVKELVTLLAAGWQQLFQCLAPHWSHKGMSVLVGFMTIIISFPSLSYLSLASFGLTPGKSQKSLSQVSADTGNAVKQSHSHFPPPPQAGCSLCARIQLQCHVPTQPLHLG